MILRIFLLQQLWSVTPPASMSRTSSSYSTWLTSSLDRALRRTLAGTARWGGNAVDYLIMRSMIPDNAKVDECTELGFAHGDLNAYNVMVDEEFRLTG